MPTNLISPRHDVDVSQRNSAGDSGNIGDLDVKRTRRNRVVFGLEVRSSPQPVIAGGRRDYIHGHNEVWITPLASFERSDLA